MDPHDPTTEPQEVRDPRPGLPPKLSRLRLKLGQKAKREPKFRFYSLYGHLLRDDVLWTSWARVRDGKGGRTPGVDGVTVDHIVNAEDGPEQLVARIREGLRDRSYRPDAVKRIEIPKANGKMRPLGIPTIRDRVVQTAVLLLLEPIFEADFLDCSHGFRPGRSAHDAVHEVSANIRRNYRAIYDADLKGYFDSIPHDKLMKGLERRISDRSMLRLIRLFLRAPIQEGKGPPRRPTSGTPQGGVISPLLANSFLHWFDLAFHGKNGPGTWAKARLVRYADDFVVMARFIDQRIIRWIEETIEGRLGLAINREKTRVLNIEDEGELLEFLGYGFRWCKSLRMQEHRRYLRVEASKRSQQRARDRMRDLTSARFCFVPPEQVVSNLNRYLRGFLNDFSVGHPKRVRWNLVRFAEERVAGHLRRRSQRPYRPPEGVSLQAHAHALGLMAVTGARG